MSASEWDDMINSMGMDIERAEWVAPDTLLPTPSFAQLLAWWQQARGAAELPSHDAIDPFALRPYLGNLILAEPVGTTPRFLVRLHGAKLSERAGYSLDKRHLDDIPNPEFRQLAIQSFSLVHAGRRPYLTLRRRMLGDDIFRYASIFLPFADAEGAAVTRIMVYLEYLD